MNVSIKSILPWARHFWTRELSPKNKDFYEEQLFKVGPELNEKVSLWQGDITKLEVDAIVNAANPSLLGGGGVDGAIHAAAGPGLVEECRTLNGCEVGEAKITKGYNLPAKHVIHTVGTMKQDPVELAESYKNSLKLFLRNSLKSIAFPCISTGIYGYNPEEAAHIALHETRSFLAENHEKVDRVIFCVFADSDLEVYEELMQRYFPVKEYKTEDLTPEALQEYLKTHPEQKQHFDELHRPREPVLIGTNSKV